MGQYFTPILKKAMANKHYKYTVFYSHEYGNGLKLVEHSYIDNCFVNAVCNELVNNPQKVIWFGDYTETGLSLRLTEKQINFLHKISNDEKYYLRGGKEQFNWDKQWFLVNHSKQVFINMKAYIESAPLSMATYDGWEGKFHPLPLLTASSNGQGGGDYFPNENFEAYAWTVGSWCNDLIELTEKKPEGYDEQYVAYQE